VQIKYFICLTKSTILPHKTADGVFVLLERNHTNSTN